MRLVAKCTKAYRAYQEGYPSSILSSEAFREELNAQLMNTEDKFADIKIIESNNNIQIK